MRLEKIKDLLKTNVKRGTDVTALSIQIVRLMDATEIRPAKTEKKTNYRSDFIHKIKEDKKENVGGSFVMDQGKSEKGERKKKG